MPHIFSMHTGSECHTVVSCEAWFTGGMRNAIVKKRLSNFMGPLWTESSVRIKGLHPAFVFRVAFVRQ